MAFVHRYMQSTYLTSSYFVRMQPAYGRCQLEMPILLLARQNICTDYDIEERVLIKRTAQ